MLMSITIDAAGIATVIATIITKDFVLVIVAQEEYLELLNL